MESLIGRVRKKSKKQRRGRKEKGWKSKKEEQKNVKEAKGAKSGVFLCSRLLSEIHTGERFKTTRWTRRIQNAMKGKQIS